MLNALFKTAHQKKIAGMIAGVAVVIAVGYAALSGNNTVPSTSQETSALAVAGEEPVPDQVTKDLATGHLAAFVVHSERKPVADFPFNGPDGQVTSLADWRGRVVLLNLWATWCAPCRKEMPELDQLQGLMGGQDFEVVALSIDRKGAEASARFLIDIKTQFLQLYTDKTSRASSKLGALGLPATILIDRQGNEVGRLLGPADWASKDALRLIKAALAEE